MTEYERGFDDGFRESHKDTRGTIAHFKSAMTNLRALFDDTERMIARFEQDKCSLPPLETARKRRDTLAEIARINAETRRDAKQDEARRKA